MKGKLQLTLDLLQEVTKENKNKRKGGEKNLYSVMTHTREIHKAQFKTLISSATVDMWRKHTEGDK